jgi:hypothetical protein
MAASTHLVWLPRATSSSCSFVKRIEVYARVLPTVTKKKRTSVSQLRLTFQGWEVSRGSNRLVQIRTFIAGHFGADDVADLAAGG